MEVLVEKDRSLTLTPVAGSYQMFLKTLSIITIDRLEAETPAAELEYFMGWPWQWQDYASEKIIAVLRVAFQILEFKRVFCLDFANKRWQSLACKETRFPGRGPPAFSTVVDACRVRNFLWHAAILRRIRSCHRPD